MTSQAADRVVVSEEERFDMASSLESHLGRQTTVSLLKHLPPNGWGDVATVRDLDQLEAKLDAKFDAKFEIMEQRFSNQLLAMQASILRWYIATMLTLVGVVATITAVLR